jgi:putative ABC transport system permease protein
MRLSALLSQAVADVRQQATRSVLTLLGIAWGTTAVVLLLAFGVGLERQMVTNARGLGDGLVIVNGGRTTLPFEGLPERRPVRLAEADADLLAREIPEIEIVTPEYGRWGRYLSVGGQRTQVYLTGVRADYGDLRNVFPQAGGRFINDRDVELNRRVIVLGNEVSRLLFGEDDPVGREVMLGRSPFTVVGVMAEKTQNSSYGARDQDRAFVPITTYRTTEGARWVNSVLFRPVDPRLSGVASDRVREVLGRKYTVHPADRDAVGIWDTNEMMRMFSYLFLGFNMFLGIVGVFTLVVGGVGVANIMFVVVQERTREFGIRRSVGARRRDIMSQVLVEALLIVAAGAILGFTTSAVVARLAGFLPIQEYVGSPVISPGVAALTVGLLTVVALAAGLLPARRAAGLDPAEALRSGS